jgi:hypothetical protein
MQEYSKFGNVISDEKIKQFVKLAMENESYTELVSLGLGLIRDIINNIAYKLGFRAYNEERSDLNVYISKIDDILRKEEIRLFDKNLIQEVRAAEKLYKRNKGNSILKRLCLPLFKQYFLLRKLKVPDVTKNPNLNVIRKDTSFKALRFLSGKAKGKSNGTENIIISMDQKIDRKTKALNNAIKSHDWEASAELFEEIFTEKSIKRGIEKINGDKIEIEGALNSNINYQASLEGFFGSLFLIISVVFFLLGSLVLFQAIVTPRLTVALGPFTLLFMCGGIIPLYLFWKHFKDEEG